MALSIKNSRFLHFLLFLTFLLQNLSKPVDCACNRNKTRKSTDLPQKYQNQPSTLMATIAFESKNEESPSMFLRTIINEFKSYENEQFDGNDGTEMHQLDSNMNRKNQENVDESLIEHQQEGEYNDDEENGNGIYELVSDANAALIGRLCLLLEPKRSAISEIGNETGSENVHFTNKNGTKLQIIESNAFLECIPFTPKEKVAFGLKNFALGIWDLGQCKNGLHFDAIQQKCVEKIGINGTNCEIKMANVSGEMTKMRMPSLHFNNRQNGGKQQFLNGCYPQCHQDELLKNGSFPKLEIGKVCSWLGSSFQADLTSPHHFLQCQPNKLGWPCGKWIRRECPSSSVFNNALQLCVLQMGQKSNENKTGMNSTFKLEDEICPQNSLPIEGHCSEGAICPGRDTFCNKNHCCIQLNGNWNKEEMFHHSTAVQMIQNYKNVCFGSGVLPSGPCSLDCPPKFLCQPNIGCCPHWHSNWEYLNVIESDNDDFDDDDYDQIGSLLCPGTENIMPEGECPNCLENLYCVPRLGGCCPHNNKLQIDLSSSEATESIEQLNTEIVPHFRCPDGSRLGPRCSGRCSNGFGCYRGYCCPMECPPDLLPISFCHPIPASIPAISTILQSSPCFAIGANCFQGICCQSPAIVPIPVVPSIPIMASRMMTMPTIVCSSGVPARMACIGAVQCPNGFECSNGGCCPIPYCHTGQQALARCYSRKACTVGSLCIEGLCCSLPICHPGVFATSFCGIGPNSGCAVGFECFNGGCCPFPAAACPMGIVPLGRCSEPMGCATGSMCYNAFCCQLPTCPGPSAGLATAFCEVMPSALSMDQPLMPVGGCQIGYECIGGGCCPLPMCPARNLAFGRCSRFGCPNGYSCFNGLCCPPSPSPIIPIQPAAILPAAILPIPTPKCSLGAIPMSLCGPNNACPIGYFCDGSNGCCPLPLPLCPFGGRALRACVRNADCPAGFGCIPMGGCCQFVTNPRPTICPLNQYPVCQCSAGICPQGANCNDGICCAPNVAVSFYQPGMRCRRSTECQGAAANLARCIRNICVCANGSHSNGAKCVESNENQLKIARTGCDEFGSQCRVHLISPKRMAIFGVALEGNRVDNKQQNNIKSDSIQKPPLWFNPIYSEDASTKDRNCLNGNGLKEEELLELGANKIHQFDADKTCLPNEKCIQGKCKRRKWPGENGCIDDLECQSRCSNTKCANISLLNSTINGENRVHGRCICQGNNILLFGQCVAKCPYGFVKNGIECKPINEDKFWQNSTLLKIIQNELDKINC